MRSSTGQHFVALDHLRAFAALMVVSWHFLHFSDGTPVPFDGAPIFFPLALIDEGHTGVALFMVLSGYLFAKLLDGKDIYYPNFIWNRFIRLAPLLILTFAAVGCGRYINGDNLNDFAVKLLRGFVYPVWPNGGWSVATELHFYVALPILLFLAKKSRLMLLGVIITAIVFRAYYYYSVGEVQSLAYWTIFGRIDQFVLGMLALFFAREIRDRVKFLPVILIGFTIFWWWFDVTGGFYGRPRYPSNSTIWIFIPTFEGLAYAAFVVWYDSRKINVRSISSQLLQKLGEYSYSIYLLHFFVVFKAAAFINRNIMDISNIYIGCFWATIFFVTMIIPGYLSYKFIESPFLRLRLNYIK